MPAPSGKSRLFVGMTVLLAGLVLVGLFPRDGLTDLPGVGTVLLLGLILFAAGLFPIPVYKSRFSVSTAVEYACILILTPAWATWTVALSTFLYHFYQYQWRTKKPWSLTLFNTAGITIPTAAAALVYRLLLKDSGFLLESWDSLLAVSSAGIVFFALNSGIHALLQGMVLKEPVFWVWKATNQPILIHWVVLGLLGLLTAIVHSSLWWSVILMALPLVAVYHAMERMSKAIKIRTKEAVEALADLVDMRDPYTYGHSLRVARSSEEIAIKMDLPPEEAEAIRTAARVHDIGKIVIDTSLLMKPGPLTEEEWREIRKHPRVGAEILARFPDFQSGREIVLQHHERYDGKGYPTGNKGESIPLGARIVAVADALDAMTSDRPYRRALDLAGVIGEFEGDKGAQWDPKVTGVMLTILRQKVQEEMGEAWIPAGVGLGMPGTPSREGAFASFRVVALEEKNGWGNGGTSIKPPSYLPEVQGFLDAILRVATHTVGVQRFSIMLFDDGFHHLLVTQATGLNEEVVSLAKVPVGEGVAGWVAANQKPLLVQDLSEAPLMVNGNGRYKTRSFASVPILVGGRVYGVLNATDKEDRSPLSEHDLATLQLLATQVGLAIERSLLQSHIQTKANTDGLTGTYNRRYFHERLEEEMFRAKSYPHSLSLLLVDLDNFKQINDSYGHLIGDRILTEVAALLKTMVRATDILCRYGGDEFVIILPQISDSGALAMAQRIERKIQGHRFLAREALRPFHLTVSIGISSYPALAKNKEALIAQADEALYWAKNSPTQRACVWKLGNPSRFPHLSYLQ